MSKTEVTEHPTSVSLHQADEHQEGPAPIGTMFVVAVLVICIIGFWMLVLGIQQGRA